MMNTTHQKYLDKNTGFTFERIRIGKNQVRKITALLLVLCMLYSAVGAGVTGGLAVRAWGGDPGPGGDISGDPISANGQCGEHMYWTLNDFILTIYGTGAMWEYDDASLYPWYEYIVTCLHIEEGVETLGAHAFEGKGLNYDWYYGTHCDLVLPDSLTSIGEACFKNCWCDTLVISKGVTSIGKNALSGKVIVDSENPSFMSTDDAVYTKNQNTLVLYCGSNYLYSMFEIPDGVERIKSGAFIQSSYSIYSIIVPGSVTDIEEYAFGNAQYHDIYDDYDVYYQGSQNEWDDINIEDGNNAFLNAERHFLTLEAPVITAVIDPDTNNAVISWEAVDGAGYYEGYRSYYDDDVYSYTVGRTTETTFTDNVDVFFGSEYWYKVRAYASEADKSLCSVLSNSAGVKYKYNISGQCGDEMYWELRAGYLRIYGTGNMWEYDQASQYPWYGLPFDKIIVEEGVESIGSYAFAGRALHPVSLPDSLTNLGDGCFSDCYIDYYLIIPKGVTSIGEGVFSGIHLSEAITVDPDNSSFMSIDGLIITKDQKNLVFCFIERWNENLYIPNGVEKILKGAFCSTAWNSEHGSRTLYIPNSLSEIEEEAFLNGSISQVYYQGTVEQWNEITISDSTLNSFPICMLSSPAPVITASFDPTTNNTTITWDAVEGAVSYEVFKKSDYWGDEYTFIGQTSETQYVNEGMYYGFYEFEQNHTYYKVRARFSDNNSNLYSPFSNSAFVDPNRIGQCGENMFWGIENGELRIYGTGEMWDYGQASQYPWYSLSFSSVRVEDGVESLGSYAFSGRNDMWWGETAVSLPASLTSIGNYAFRGSSCRVTIDPQNASYMSKDGSIFTKNQETLVYAYVSGGYEIPNGVERIKSGAFCNNDISVLYIPISLTYIEEDAFENLWGCICTIYYQGTREEWNAINKTSGNEELNAECFVFGAISSPVVSASHDPVTHYSVLSWEAVEGAGYYEIYRAPEKNGWAEYELIAGLDGTQYIDNEPLDNNYYKVKAYRSESDMSVYSFFSNVVNPGFGKCGDDSYWEFSDGTLRISGTGEINTPNYGETYWDTSGQPITEVIIGDGIEALPYDGFSNCKSMRNIVIGNGVKYIRDYTFESFTSLESVTIGNGVKTIGYMAFRGCVSLTDVYYLGTRSEWDSINSDWGNEPLTQATIHCIDLEAPVISIDIDRATLNVSISWEAVDDAEYYEIYRSEYEYGEFECIATITETSFTDEYSSEVAQWYMVKTCKTIDGWTVVSSSNIECTSHGQCGEYVYWTLAGDTLKVFGTGDMWDNTGYYTSNNYSFVSRDFSNVIIEDGVTSIGAYAFYDCYRLTNVTIPEGVVSIGNNAFDGCSMLQNAAIPESVTSIGEYAFHYCGSLSEIAIPDGVTSIGNRTFFGCTSLTSLTIPESVTSIGHRAFAGCASLTDITIPDGITSIGWYVYSGCESLTSITIPNSVVSIGRGAFSECRALTSIIIPDSVTSIGYRAFADCDSLTSIVIPNSVTGIGNGAFYDCTSLTSIDIPDSVTSIGEYVFSSCESLTSITIPNSVTSIGGGAFGNCTSLTSITIPNSVTNIGGSAFHYCSLTSIDIPDSVTNIGYSAFHYCPSLTSINVDPVNNYYSSVDGVLFNKDQTTLICCPEGKSGAYSIPDSVASIGDWAFEYCTSLTSIDIPNSVTSIGDAAFLDCSSLSDIYFFGTQEEWNAVEIDYFYGPGEYYYLQGVTLHIVSVSLSAPSISSALSPENYKPVLTFSGGGSAESFELYRSVDNETFTLLSENAESPYNDTSASFGTTYYYKVRGVQTAGSRAFYSDYSDVVSAKPELPAPIISGSATGYNSAAITITAVSGATGYRLYRSNSQNGNYTTIGTTTSLTFNDTGLTPGTTYYYKAEAFVMVDGSEQLGAESNIVSVRPVLDAPTLRAERASYNSNTLTLTAVTGALGYKIYRSDSMTGSFSLIATTSSLTYTDAGLTSGTTYYYKAKAYANSGASEVYSADTAVVSARPMHDKTGWNKIGNNWYYFNTSGVMLKNWQKVDSKWYYLGTDGAMKTGWQKIDNKWYYLGTDGAMKTGWQKVDNKWYYLGADGVMKTGWLKVDSKWYYLNASGVMQTGWQKVDNKWYYLGTDGIMKTEWQKVDSKWYYLGIDGVMKTGWQKVDNKWYYLNTSGVMQTGWQKLDSKWYYLGTDGVMRTGWQKIDSDWYYFGTNGVMVTNKWVDDCYLTSSGKMAVNTWIDGYYVGADGKWVRGKKK